MQDMEEEKAILLGLREQKGWGNRRCHRLLGHWEETETKSSFLEWVIEEGEKENIEREGIEKVIKNLAFWQRIIIEEKPIYYREEEYPSLLKEIYNPPLFLFWQGKIELLQKPSLAFIGSRKMQKEAQQQVTQFIQGLKEEYVIVSGLARGVDAESQFQALKHKGSTIAVLGNGLDYYYPKENQALQQIIAKKGLLLSEYRKGTVPKKYHFPARNRIIAGLCQGIIVIQAGEKSGTFITAKIGLEEGREVFVLPGSTMEHAYDGSYSLLREGAELVWQPEQIYESLTFWR